MTTQQQVNTLNEAQDYCRNLIHELVEKHNKEYTKSYEHLSISIEFSNRLSKTLGYCSTKRSSTSCGITLSNIFIKDRWNKNYKEDIKELVIHEVAHAVVRVLYGYGHGHDNLFRNTVTRLGGSLFERSSKKHTEYKPYRYIYKCPNCGKIMKKRTISHGACAKCCNEFNNRKYTDKYKWVLVEDKGRVDTWG